MNSHALTRRPQIAAVDSAATPRHAKRAAVEIARVIVLSQQALGAIAAAQRLGVRMECTLEYGALGGTLTVRRAAP